MATATPPVSLRDWIEVYDAARELRDSKDATPAGRTRAAGQSAILEKCPHMPWIPFPGAQTEAYLSFADDLLYGGAGGGGKSSLLIGLALTAHHRSLILRRQAVQVGEVVEQLRNAAGRRARWRSLGYGGTMRTGDGRFIEVGGCDEDGAWIKYAGRPHDLVALDEAAAMTRNQFRSLCGWNRHEDPAQRCRAVLASNPPSTVEGRWIVEEFAPWVDRNYPKPAAPGELRWYTMLAGQLSWLDGPEEFTHRGERIKPKSRTFIPARLADNPILARTDYGARLQALPEPLRSQLLYGDFSAGIEDDPWQVIPTAWVEEAMGRWVEGVYPCPLTCSGLDVSRGGRDETVLARRYGGWFDRLTRWPGREITDGPEAAHRVARAIEARGTPADRYAPINVDVIGYGSSAYDSLIGLGWNAVPINFACAAPSLDRAGVLAFANLRAFAYWSLREALDPRTGDNLALPPDRELLADLTAPKYSRQGTRVLVEPKEQVTKRLGRSPDLGDALVMANLDAGWFGGGEVPAEATGRAGY